MKKREKDRKEWSFSRSFLFVWKDLKFICYLLLGDCEAPRQVTGSTFRLLWADLEETETVSDILKLIQMSVLSKVLHYYIFYVK